MIAVTTVTILTMFTLACDQLNRPLNNTGSSSSSTSGGSSARALDDDADASANDGGPTFMPQPGDIQL